MSSQSLRSVLAIRLDMGFEQPTSFWVADSERLGTHLGNLKSQVITQGEIRLNTRQARCRSETVADGRLMLPLSADDPRVIGEFRLHTRLGAGGTGRVYLASSPGGRALDGTSLTTVGYVLGTPAYMSPNGPAASRPPPPAMCSRSAPSCASPPPVTIRRHRSSRR